MSAASFVLLPGDGIGPEVVAAAQVALEAVSQRFGHDFVFSKELVGGAAMEVTGDPLPDRTLEACRASDVVILGAVGGPAWEDPAASTRPEAGLLALRKELGLFANLRPVKASPHLRDASPLKPEIVRGTDILFVRELTGGIYFGASGRSADGTAAHSVMEYSVAEIERIVRIAGATARERRGKVTSVDKANVLEVSRLWRSVAASVMSGEFPDVEYEVVLVDAMAMHLLGRPRDFDVVVTANLFGDILTDLASMLPGSLGLLPSASVGAIPPGLYEPVHGSAPDIAGTDRANPLGTILAAAMALRHSLGLEAEAAALESAVDRTLAGGHRTADLAGPAAPSLRTSEMAAAVAAAVGDA